MEASAANWSKPLMKMRSTMNEATMMTASNTWGDQRHIDQIEKISRYLKETKNRNIYLQSKYKIDCKLLLGHSIEPVHQGRPTYRPGG